mmetsp:Transcript_29875/g.54727  ORF Transcript_29875/g.54727 Transcript_29875/m.54727 type:complete len:229 (+) Transcript_29875:269-955(+)
MNSTLFLCGWRSDFEPEFSIIKTFPGALKAIHTCILQAVPNTLNEVRNVSTKGTLILDGSTDSLRNLNGCHSFVPNISFFTSLTHGLQTSHTTVPFQPNSILVKVFTRCLICSRKHTSHHDTASSAAEGLGNVARGLDTAIRQNGNTILACKLGHMVDGTCLGPPDRTHFLSRTNRPNTHAHTQSIYSSLNQMEGLNRRHHITTNHIYGWMRFLEVFHNIELIDGITL